MDAILLIYKYRVKAKHIPVESRDIELIIIKGISGEIQTTLFYFHYV